MPIAMRKDGKAMIMRAIMGSPGAGGSGSDYGFAQLAIAPATGNGKLWVHGDEMAIRISGSALFYDGDTKAVSSEHAGTPEECPPCFYASDNVIATDLVTGKSTTVSTGAKGTSFLPVRINETKRVVSVDVTTYKTPTGCTDLSCREVSSKETKEFLLGK
jgi:hypothetical protein